MPRANGLVGIDESDGAVPDKPVKIYWKDLFEIWSRWDARALRVATSFRCLLLAVGSIESQTGSGNYEASEVVLSLAGENREPLTAFRAHIITNLNLFLGAADFLGTKRSRFSGIVTGIPSLDSRYREEERA